MADGNEFDRFGRYVGNRPFGSSGWYGPDPNEARKEAGKSSNVFNAFAATTSCGNSTVPVTLDNYSHTKITNPLILLLEDL